MEREKPQTVATETLFTNEKGTRIAKNGFVQSSFSRSNPTKYLKMERRFFQSRKHKCDKISGKEKWWQEMMIITMDDMICVPNLVVQHRCLSIYLPSFTFSLEHISIINMSRSVRSHHYH